MFETNFFRYVSFTYMQWDISQGSSQTGLDCFQEFEIDVQKPV